MFKIIETFSGIGAQAKAFENLNTRTGIEYKVMNTCEWDVNAIIAYCNIHKGLIDVDKYAHVTDEEINAYLTSKTISMDGKKPINEKTYKRLSIEFKRMIYCAIQETSNFVSITDLKGEDIDEGVDLFTYSFPCQDLSICGYWHGNKSGISREAHNRSGMLWEVERILKEMHVLGRKLPRFLVMENVKNILSSTHKEDFDDWKATLVSLGYYNKIYRLNAKNFGVPQKRERAYMVSILVDNDIMKVMELERYFRSKNLEDVDVANKATYNSFDLKSVLRLDYSVDKYREEADASQPNDTPSRQKIYKDNDLLFDGNNYYNEPLNTVTTKQDRNPNSGVVFYDNEKEGKSKWRYLTPRECFMLMGFDESDYDNAVKNNPMYTKTRKLLTTEKLVKMAGNSICVNVLEAIFEQIIEINEDFF